MIIITLDSGTPSRACWRYADKMPTPEQLLEIGKVYSASSEPQWCLVFNGVGHEEVHAYFDQLFGLPPDPVEDSKPKLALVKPTTPEEGN